ncbi:MARVEL domain-containing protein 2, partial [Striga asiatica]
IDSATDSVAAASLGGRDTLLVPEKVSRIDPCLNFHQPIKILLKILLPVNFSLAVAGLAGRHNSDVQIPVVEIRLPRIFRHVRRHELVQLSRLSHEIFAVRPVVPTNRVLDLEQVPVPVGERRRRRRNPAVNPAVRVEHHPHLPAPDYLVEYPVQAVDGDRFLHVVRFSFEVTGRVGVPVQELLRRSGEIGPVVPVKDRLDPRHLVAGGSCQAQLGEITGRDVEEVSARAEVLPDERGPNGSGSVSGDRLDEDPHEELVVHGRHGLLGAGADPGGPAGGVDVDRPEVGHVEHGEPPLAGDVGRALIVMAAAADPEVDFEPHGADDGGADVGLRCGGDDEAGPRGGARVEAAVADALDKRGIEWGVIRGCEGK